MTTVSRPVSGMSVISLVCGLVWFFGLGSVLAVIYGLIGLRECRTKNMRGAPLAITGVLLGTFGLIAVVIYVVSNMP